MSEAQVRVLMITYSVISLLYIGFIIGRLSK
jgi:hypothetical protein